jgi:hypothetical protein
MTGRRQKMAETCGSVHVGSVGSCGDASARVGSVCSGHTYAFGSCGGVWAPSHAGMACRADPLGREHAGASGRAQPRSSVGVHVD